MVCLKDLHLDLDSKLEYTLEVQLKGRQTNDNKKKSIY